MTKHVHFMPNLKASFLINRLVALYEKNENLKKWNKTMRYLCKTEVVKRTRHLFYHTVIQKKSKFRRKKVYHNIHTQQLNH